MAGIKPDCADSGIDAALDIRGQAVPDDYCCFLMEPDTSGIDRKEFRAILLHHL